MTGGYKKPGRDTTHRHVPWSVKGVLPEAREAAKLAARKAGAPLGAWLSQTILSTAAVQLKRDAPPASQAGGMTPPYGQPAPHQGPNQWAGQWSGQYEPGYYAQGESPPQTPQPPAPLPAALAESIQRLVQRIDETEVRTAEAIEPIAEKVNELSQRLEASKASGSPNPGLERAVTRLAERLQKLEEGEDGPVESKNSQGESGRGLFGRRRRR